MQCVVLCVSYLYEYRNYWLCEYWQYETSYVYVSGIERHSSRGFVLHRRNMVGSGSRSIVPASSSYGRLRVGIQVYVYAKVLAQM